MKGKDICKRLKDIRLSIAEANEIEYTPAQCDHKGDCGGTCPQCEKEVRYLEQQLLRRNAIGKAAMVAGLALGATSIAPAMAQTQVQSNATVAQSAEPKLVDCATNDSTAIIVRGYVIDNTDREPIIGTSIVVLDEHNKLTRYGTVTNIDGRFAIRVSKGSKVQVAFVGYETETLTLDEPNDNLLIILQEAKNALVGDVIYIPPKMPDVDSDIYEMR